MAAASVDVEVLIAGGGPVGLCLAFLLAERGHSVIVAESESGLVRELRASTFHPPTLDMLAPWGIAAELVKRGLPCPTWQIRLHPSGERAVFDMGVLEADTGHPFRLQCEQWKLSEALLERLEAMRDRVDLRYLTVVEGLSAHDDSVAVSCRRGASAETIRARFVVGCDGARSAVRRSMDLPFEGATYPETTLLVTTDFPFEEHLEGLSNVTYCWKDGGNFSLLKVPGRWRVSIYPREDLSIEEQLSEESVEAALQEIVPRTGRYNVMEKRPYRVHQRIVPTYVQGRVALAGDAAHLNSPAGGMGLNGGSTTPSRWRRRWTTCWPIAPGRSVSSTTTAAAGRWRPSRSSRRPIATGRGCARRTRPNGVNSWPSCRRPVRTVKRCGATCSSHR